MKALEIELRILEARLKSQQNFSMNIDMQVQSKVTQAEISEIKKIISELDSDGEKQPTDSATAILPDVSGTCEHPLNQLMFWNTSEVECKICGYKSLTF